MVGAGKPSWSPDGVRIGYLLAGQLFVKSLSEEQPRLLTDPAVVVSSFLWSPDGHSIAFVGSRTPDKDELPPGVQIFTRADYRVDSSYPDYQHPAHLWVVTDDAGGGSHARELSRKGDRAATLAFWSRDSKSIYVTSGDSAEAYYGGGNFVLRSVRISDGRNSLVRQLTTPGSEEDLDEAPNLALSPDGRLAAFVMGNPADPPNFRQSDVFVMDLATGVTRNLTAAYDRDVGGDHLEWGGNRTLFATSIDSGDVDLVRIDVRDETVTPWWQGHRAVQSIRRSARGRLLAIASDAVTAPEVYDVTDPRSPIKLTAFNQALTDNLDLTPPETISYRGPGGETIHGWLQKPAAFSPDEKYPTIVWCHGGPHSSWTDGYSGDVQAMAGAGYLVLLLNPRGSDGFGETFASVLDNHWPGLDFDDVMAGVDYISKRPYVDTRRLGIAGSSAGGVMTDWAITHTSRFQAAVSISDIADFVELWFIGDQPALRPGKDAEPWLQEREHSPINFARDITTPTLFITGERDFRTPSAAGGEMLFRVLKFDRVPTALIRFEGAGHSIYSGSDARHPGLRIYYLIRWMDMYLKGIPASEFAKN
jgi:dipeptidyl aminopeptidase/acylaminoacyl peptidase